MSRRAVSRVISCGLVCAVGIGATLASTGCVDRRIRVTTEPPGARVWVNDADLGRTPAEVGFTFYGHYEVRLELDGYEPVTENREAKAPIYEQPGLDLIAEAIPLDFENNILWHFDLQPALEDAIADSAPGSEARNAFERDLVLRSIEASSAFDTDAGSKD